MSQYQIPPLLQKIFPNLKPKEYQSLKEEPGFWKKKTLLCEDCYLRLATSILASGNYDKTEALRHSRDLVGVGPLHPESLTQQRFVIYINFSDILTKVILRGQLTILEERNEMKNSLKSKKKKN